MMKHTVRSLASALPLLCVLAPAAGVSAADESQGAALYATRCAFCHGVSGKGDGPAGAALDPPPTRFDDAAFWSKATPETMRNAIVNGKPATAMMPFKNALTAQEVDDIIAYLQSLRPRP
jgi:high-affinity iron transporter